MDLFVLCMYTLLHRVLYHMYMHSRCGPVFIFTSGGKCRDRLVKCCCLLLTLQDVCLVRSGEVGMAALRGGRSLIVFSVCGGGGVSFKGAAAVLRVRVCVRMKLDVRVTPESSVAASERQSSGLSYFCA